MRVLRNGTLSLAQHATVTGRERVLRPGKVRLAEPMRVFECVYAVFIRLGVWQCGNMSL